VRIIGGAARGTRLVAPADRRIRPTLDRVREALFNILAPRIEGSRFLDLFAGTGAVGLEALSRGAVHVDWVEADTDARGLIRENLRRTRLASRGGIRAYRVEPDQPLRVAGPYDIVYADPPHAFEAYDALLKQAGDVLASDGVFVLEHASTASPPEAGGGLSRYRRAAYGRSILSFYERTG